MTAAWLAGVCVLAQSSASAQTGSLTITVRCTPNPEQITVKNSTGSPLTIQRIESSEGPPVNGEPIDVPAKLPNVAVIANDQSITYENGPNAAGNVLLPNEIFDDSRLALENLILTTDRGAFRVPCGSGLNTQTFSIGGTPSPTAASPGGFQPPSAGQLGGVVGTAQANAANALAPAQQTAAAAAATVGQAGAPLSNAANTITAPAQATVGNAAQVGAAQVSGAVPPGLNATVPGVPPVFVAPQATAGGPTTPTATPSSPATGTPTAGAAPAQAGGISPWVLLPLGGLLLILGRVLGRRAA